MQRSGLDVRRDEDERVEEEHSLFYPIRAHHMHLTLSSSAAPAVPAPASVQAPSFYSLLRADTGVRRAASSHGSHGRDRGKGKGKGTSNSKSKGKGRGYYHGCLLRDHWLCPSVSNYSMQRRVLGQVEPDSLIGVHGEDLGAFSSTPLLPLQLHRHIAPRTRQERGE